jgi:hypothetical protein
MKLTSDASQFPNPQHLLQYTFGPLVSSAFTQVDAYITDEGINLADVPTLITILKTTFGELKCIMTVKSNLEDLNNKTNCNFSTYFVGFQPHTTDVQWNDSTKCTAVMWCLKNVIKEALFLSNNILQ